MQSSIGDLSFDNTYGLVTKDMHMSAAKIAAYICLAPFSCGLTLVALAVEAYGLSRKRARIAQQIAWQRYYQASSEQERDRRDSVTNGEVFD
jgi:hypothetical protein